MARETFISTLEKIAAAINTRGRLFPAAPVDNLRLKPNFSPGLPGTSGENQ